MKTKTLTRIYLWFLIPLIISCLMLAILSGLIGFNPRHAFYLPQPVIIILLLGSIGGVLGIVLGMQIFKHADKIDVLDEAIEAYHKEAKKYREVAARIEKKWLTS